MIYQTNTKTLMRAFFSHRLLMLEMIKREIFGRYREQFGGIAWSIANPLIMLAVYTFFFSIVFKARWAGTVRETHSDFALILFAGLITFTFFSECISRAPQLIVTNANFVKKIIFPLEILPGIAMGSALFHAGISFTILIFAQIIIDGNLPWTIVFVPLVFLPLMVLVMGLSWFLAATGVYIRDIGHVTGFMLPIFMFVSPIFCPLSAFPGSFKLLIYLNPLTCIVEEIRNVMIFGVLPNWFNLSIYLLVSSIIALLGFRWFQKTRSGFADVL